MPTFTLTGVLLMTVNENVKKMLALLAVMDDTQEHINRMKVNLDDKIRALRAETATQTTNLHATFDEQVTMLEKLLGITPSRPTTAPRRQGMFDDPWSDEVVFTQQARKKPNLNALKEQAFSYIGKQMMNPTDKKGNKDG